MQAIMATPAAVKALPTVQLRRIAIGGRIYAAGTEGIAWRVKSGAVRLDRISPEGSNYAGLALRGDVIGAETLLFGKYSFEASAIGDCELEPWLAAGKSLSGESLLQTLADAERRAADALALRAGEAFERVRQLCLLLARYRDDGRKEIAIPGLRDMAAITNLTEATVSRAMSRLRRMGILQRQGRRRGLVLLGADPAFAL
ncbi:MAG: helix-turn-helix domain-containing protein [Rhodocyclales bacterium]|nr:helix-turn-helix domain-containing protein [Rhodocyclales bacterium]